MRMVTEARMDRIPKPAKLIKRGNSYQLYYYSPDGGRRRSSVGSDLQQAQRIAVKFTDWLVEGKDPVREMERARQAEKARGITLKDFFPEFMECYGSKQSKSMVTRYHFFFKNIERCPGLVEIPINQISKRLILDYMQARMKQDSVKAATVNREAAFLRGMLSRAVEWDILDSNPLQGLKLFKEEDKRKVALTPSQATTLLEYLPHPLDDIVEFAIYTGFRKENILSLKLEQIRFHDLQKNGEVDLILKGGRKEVFPLSKQAVEILRRAIGDRKSGYIFINPDTGTRYYSVNRTFSRAVDRLGFKVGDSRLRFHDLRHVFATWLHQAGVSLDVLRPLLGHRDRDTTDRYAYLDLRAVGEVLNIMPRLRQKKAPMVKPSRPSQRGC